MFRKFKESRHLFLVILVFVISIFFITIYSDFAFTKNRQKNIEQRLFQIGKNYEYEINKELEKYKSLTELISVSFSEQVEKKGFILNSKVLLTSIISSHKRITAISLVLKKPSQNNENQTLTSPDSADLHKIDLIKLEGGVINEEYENSSIDLSLNAEIEKAVLKEQTKILSPLVYRIGIKDKVVIPVISSIFEGKRYLGYLIFYIKLDWDEENMSGTNEYKAYVSTSNGKILSIKDNDLFISENIEKVCFPCSDLLGETGTMYSSLFENNNLTVCFTTNIQNTISQWGICLRVDESFAERWSANRLLIWIFAGLMLVLGILAFVFLNRSFEKPWHSVKLMVSNLINGRFDENDFSEIKDDHFNETKDSLAILNKSLNSLSDYSKLAVLGNFEKQSDIIGFKHKIVNSSLTLYKHLETTENKLIKSGEETSQIKKFTDNLEEISKVLKSHHKNIITLSEQIIKSIVDLMDIAMGAIFLAQKNEEETILELVSSYAYHENKYHKKQFKLGESLVGACAAERRIVHLSKIPEDYLKILSGLGETSPKSLLIIPLIFEEEVLGVIELGSLNEFNEASVHFAESASTNIASTLSLAQNSIRNAGLLEQTRKQTKELEEQERKMKEALTELRSLQTKTAKSEAEIRSKLEAMNNTLLIVEYTTEGILLDANYKFLNTMHYSLEEIKGNNVIELLKEEDREELLKVISMVKSGNFYESVMRRHTKQGQEKWFLASYTPVFNDEGVVQNILFFGIDITRIKVSEEKLKLQVKEMTEEIEKLKKQD
jgi:PAS domain S-box-containing protein